MVSNAVDDHLSGSNQIQVRWMVDDLRLLGPLLSERVGRRVVIVTADHGHVIDDGTVQRGQGRRSLAVAVGHTGRERVVGLRGRPVKTASGNTVVLRAWSGRATRGQEKSQRRIGAGGHRCR